MKLSLKRIFQEWARAGRDRSAHTDQTINRYDKDPWASGFDNWENPGRAMIEDEDDVEGEEEIEDYIDSIDESAQGTFADEKWSQLKLQKHAQKEKADLRFWDTVGDFNPYLLNQEDEIEERNKKNKKED